MSRCMMTAVLLLASTAVAQTISVPNPSFEAGTDAPAGWSLSTPTGEWLRGDVPEGERGIAVTGTGRDTNYWRSAGLALEPSVTYRVSFQAKRVSGAGGTPVTGPIFCNRDLGGIPEQWQRYSSVFFTPRSVSPEDAWLRFGQWHVKGTIAYDDIGLVRVQPVYTRAADLVLGAGETIKGNAYAFQAPLQAESRNHSRPLQSDQCGFNSNRWVFGAGSDVVYVHRIGTRLQTQVKVRASVTYYSGGELVLEAAPDGKAWRQIGVKGELGDLEVDVPGDLQPAAQIWIRLRARAKEKVGTESDPGSFQVTAYSYSATVDGTPCDAQGRTRFLTLLRRDPALDVTVEDLGEGLPGGRNVVSARVVNRTGRRVRITPGVIITQDGRQTPAQAPAQELGPGEQVVPCEYTVPGTGVAQLQFSLGAAVNFACETELYVPDYYNSSYGERLPGSSDGVVLWWASSGWKIPQRRHPPTKAGTAMRISAARNEAEAAQMVVRPTVPLRGLRMTPGPLRRSGGGEIPSASIDVLRVRYVPVTQATDRTGLAAPWPDPLPPLRGPVDLTPGRNQPFWVRVNVPRDAAPGVYSGALELAADGYSAQVPLRVQVYDFTLPDRMTCTTAFGFSPGNVWRYQKVSDPVQRRQVLAKYWESFSKHHISPYDPAPLDPFRVQWPKLGDWTGGSRDRTQKRSGQASLRLRDSSSNTNVSTHFNRALTIPQAGYRFRFWYKTEEPGHEFIVTLNHHDATDSWMSGRNNDMRLTGTGEWQLFDRTITAFPVGATSVRLTLWATSYREDGAYTGTVWYDDVSLQDAATDAELLTGGAFEPADLSALEPTFDWTAWDTAMTQAMDTYHFNSFRLPIQGLGGGTFHARRDPSLLGFTEDTPEYQTAFRAYVGAIDRHLRAQGWLDRAFIYWFDEPAPKDYEFVSNGFRKLKETAPGLRRMLTEQVEEELLGGPNVWCPVSPNYDHEAAEARRKQGEHFWWYVCCGPKAPYCTLFIDHPATELRVWLWQTWQRGIEGVLVWQTNYWTSSAAYPDAKRPQNPYEDPMGWVSGYSTERGTKRPWGNGDGRFIYPPEAAADAQQQQTVLDGPVDSMRWEMLRDGLEDYEYLVMLRSLLREKAARLTSTQRDQVQALLAVPESITVDMTTFSKDPAPIEQRRDEIARALESLLRL